MSVENLKEYARRCANEPELRTKAKAIGVSNIDAHIQQAGTLGLDWAMDDIVAFRKELVDAEGDIEELGEEELEQVAGGIVTIVAAVVVGSVAVAGAAVAGGASASAAAGDSGW